MESLRVAAVETSIPSDETYKTHLFEASLRALHESCPIVLRGIDLLSQRTGQDEFLQNSFLEIQLNDFEEVIYLDDVFIGSMYGRFTFI